MTQISGADGTRLAAFTVKQKGFAAVAPLVPHLVRRVVEQAAAERHSAELEELAGAAISYFKADSTTWYAANPGLWRRLVPGLLVCPGFMPVRRALKHVLGARRQSRVSSGRQRMILCPRAPTSCETSQTSCHDTVVPIQGVPARHEHQVKPAGIELDLPRVSRPDAGAGVCGAAVPDRRRQRGRGRQPARRLAGRRPAATAAAVRCQVRLGRACLPPAACLLRLANLDI